MSRVACSVSACAWTRTKTASPAAGKGAENEQQQQRQQQQPGWGVGELLIWKPSRLSALDLGWPKIRRKLSEAGDSAECLLRSARRALARPRD